MSGKIAVAAGLNNFAMFGVKGGVTHTAGQADNRVREPICAGKGSATPVPLSGYENVLWPVGGSSCARLATAVRMERKVSARIAVAMLLLPEK